MREADVRRARGKKLEAMDLVSIVGDNKVKEKREYQQQQQQHSSACQFTVAISRNKLVTRVCACTRNQRVTLEGLQIKLKCSIVKKTNTFQGEIDHDNLRCSHSDGAFADVIVPITSNCVHLKHLFAHGSVEDGRCG